MKSRYLTFFSIVMAAAIAISFGCSSNPITNPGSSVEEGGGGGGGGTETGSTTPAPFDILTYGDKVQSMGEVLVPSIASQAPASISKGKTKSIHGTTSEDTWSVISMEYNYETLEAIFGDPASGNGTPTKIRTLLEMFKARIDAILAVDENIECTGDLIKAFDGGDTIELPFFGIVANGTADDRYFDCLYAYEQDDSTHKALYGVDELGNVRFAFMTDNVTGYTSSEEMGDHVKQMNIFYSTYGESEESGTTSGFLDLQFASASIYAGYDNAIGTNDDPAFKARSRITGVSTLDSEGNVQTASGDFTVTKYDIAYGGNEYLEVFTTMTAGRGSFGDGDVSLFMIDSDISTMSGTAGIYCITSEGGAMPSYADPENCSTLLDAFPWTGRTFPFELAPEMTADFSSKELFNPYNGDLIECDGSNFSIPEYLTK